MKAILITAFAAERPSGQPITIPMSNEKTDEFDIDYVARLSRISLTDDEKKSLRSDGLSSLAEDGLDYLTIKGRITVAQLRGNKEKKT